MRNYRFCTPFRVSDQQWHIDLYSSREKSWLAQPEKQEIYELLEPLRHTEHYWLLNTKLVTFTENIAMEIWMKLS